MNSALFPSHDRAEKNRARYQTRVRAFCFTINNPNETDTPMFCSRMGYLVFQREKGKQGTVHLQGYVFFKKRTSIAMAKRIISSRAHVEVAKGTPTQNRDYCTKADGRVSGPYEYGELPVQGKRNDLLNLKKMIDKGLTNREIADVHFGNFLRYHKGINAYRLLHQMQRKWKTRVVIIYGPTGTGKSAFAFSMFKNAFWKPSNTKWWDNYIGQKVVVFDDFNVPWFGFDTLKRILDRYPLMVETKGGHTQFLAKTLVITTNTHPRQWYRKLFLQHPHMYDQLERRIDILAYKGSFIGGFVFEKTTKEEELESRVSLQTPKTIVLDEAQVIKIPSLPDMTTRFNKEKERQSQLSPTLSCSTIGDDDSDSWNGRQLDVNDFIDSQCLEE